MTYSKTYPQHYLFVALVHSLLASGGAHAVSFATEVIVDDTDGFVNMPVALQLGDLDGDGDLDFVFPGGSGPPWIIGWLENRGCSPLTFVQHVVTADAHGPQTVQLRDMDGDGDLDVVTVHLGDDRVSWYENDGCRPPTFTEHVIPTAASEPRDAAVADIDGDDDMDIVIGWDTGAAGRKLTWQENDGSSTPGFAAHLIGSSSGLTDIHTVVIEDMDDDGDADILAAPLNGPTMWFENDGASPPSFTRNTIATTGAVELFAADVNGDDCIDAVAATAVNVVLYRSDCAMNPIFTVSTVGGAGSGPVSVFATDLDDDGNVDILAALQFDHTIAWYKNDGMTIPTFTQHDIYTSADGAIAVFAADIDGDGDIDAASASINDDKIAWFESDVLAATPNCPAEQALAFSVDVGSDGELSDPNHDGDEGFDPGDLYRSDSVPVDAVTGGRDGAHFDDASVYAGTDPWPDAPDPAEPPASAVPVGSGGCAITPTCYDDYFDIDGADTINARLGLNGFGILPTGPLQVPIRQADVATECFKNCIYTPKHLAVSFDDDGNRSWIAADDNVPVASTSPAGMTYGSSLGFDEIIGLTLDLSVPGGPYSAEGYYQAADEFTLHPSLVPNPDSIETADDDADALDVLHYDTDCAVQLYSVDHEANYGLSPGAIYQYPGPATPVLRPDTHLGLPGQTDIDAFEMTWLTDPDTGLLSLAILFSVDDDDPRTFINESGGLDPSVVYASFMTGAHFVFSDLTTSRLYGVANSGDVVRIDRDTGAATLLGNIPYNNLNAAAVRSDNRIFVIDGDELIEIDIDPVSGSVASTVYWSLSGRPVGTGVRGMAFDPSDLLYVVLNNSSGDLLYTIADAGGSGEFLPVGIDGNTGLNGLQSLAFDSAGTLYTIDISLNGLYTLSTVTALPTLIGGCVLGSEQTLEFDIDGTLLAGRNQLLEISMTCAVPAVILGPISDGVATYDIRGFAVVAGPSDDIDALAVAPSAIELEMVPDSDDDGVHDAADNCIEAANTDQRDTDGDNIGNVCDTDIAVPNDCMVNFLDLTALSDTFFSTPVSPNWNADGDFNGDDAVNFIDLTVMAEIFFGTPGPSGLPNDCDGS